MGDGDAELLRVRVVEDLDDDLVVRRRETGATIVLLAGWLHPAQRLVSLRLAADVLDAEPSSALVMNIRSGQVLARSRDVAEERLVDLMDRRELSTNEWVEAVELVCRR